MYQNESKNANGCSPLASFNDQSVPTSVVPRYVNDRQRKEELSRAIIRKAADGFAIPVAWVKEHNEIVDRQNGPGCNE